MVHKPISNSAHCLPGKLIHSSPSSIIRTPWDTHTHTRQMLIGGQRSPICDQCARRSSVWAPSCMKWLHLGIFRSPGWIDWFMLFWVACSLTQSSTKSRLMFRQCRRFSDRTVVNAGDGWRGNGVTSDSGLAEDTYPPCSYIMNS